MKDKLNKRININVVMDYVAREKKKVYEEMMNTECHAECLDEELTILYFKNNLDLLTTKN